MTSRPFTPPQGPNSSTRADNRAGAVAQVRSRLADAHTPGIQIGLDLTGTPLSEVEWIVVDLETTGLGSKAAITEIGAVRVRGTTVVDEFHTMVDPDQPIPPRITALTGITSSMVHGAPMIEQAYTSFHHWARLGRADNPGVLEAPGALGVEVDGAPVLVAHNASFDIPFLRRAARAAGLEWPRTRVLDTLALARLVLPRPMVPNHRLGTLAAHFRTSPQTNHRALGDAHTTVEVLAGLVALMEGAGVSTLEDLTTVGAPVPRSRRRRVTMADDLPRAPGTYRFIDEAGAALYIGSATNLRSRVRSYFTASETRARIRRMLDLAVDVQVTVTSSVLEARVAELRDIRRLRPLFNSASTHQDSQYWVVREGSRLECHQVVPTPSAQGALGPFGTRAHADRARDALSATYCPVASGPLLRSGVVEVDLCSQVDAALRGEHQEVLNRLGDMMSAAAEREDFEGAARWREALAAYLVGVRRRWSVLPLASASKVIWAFHRDEGGWILHCASWGRLVSTVVTPARTMPTPWVEALLAEDVPPAPEVFLARTTREEARLLASSLGSEGARLVHWEGPLSWSEPVSSPLGRTDLIRRLGVAGEDSHLLRECP